MRKLFVFAWEIVKIVVISLAIIVPVRYYLIQPFFVYGASMEPNFSNGNYLIINEIGYRLGEPQRSEVVVFKYPLNPSQYYIKRIVGLPGETVEIKDGLVFIYNQSFPDGMVLDESLYLPKDRITSGNTKIKLGEDEYFVLGDNRQASSDSRRWGALPEDNIIGRAWIRAWPFNSAEVY
ncbi:signal peptidase I [Patescibacteria group bacterium]|nr:signal peptidase I [Patescibacteria group bacterium]MBU2579600.1 signal peptidase I [Patescibacteria group bacterium]MBU4030695.1 signal peptidase I [Patescibacteria group bacterium]MCG2809333.1 signal peptidase I [Candidatus Portnoybacteria bacterium]